MMNVCAETYPVNSKSYPDWNPFVGMEDKIENEHYDPYVFPTIVEKETETEQTSSFSVWQTDEILQESEIIEEALIPKRLQIRLQVQ